MKEEERPGIAVDGIVIDAHKVLLMKRAQEPYLGYWCIPGGFVEYGEEVEEAVKREVLEETGVSAEVIGLIGVFSKRDRGPRGHVISIAYLLKPISDNGEFDKEEVINTNWFHTEEARRLNLGFDHVEMLKMGIDLYNCIDKINI